MLLRDGELMESGFQSRFLLEHVNVECTQITQLKHIILCLGCAETLFFEPL